MPDALAQVAERLAKIGQSPLALTVPEAAATLRISETAFRTHVLPSLPITEIGSIQRVSVAALAAWVERHTASSLFGEGQSAAGPSAIDSTASVASSQPASRHAAKKQRQRELLESFTRKQSEANSNVVPLRGRKSRSRRAQRNG